MYEDQTATDMPKIGRIVLPGAKDAVDCIIQEISATGAHLKVAAPLALPQHFAFAAGEVLPREASIVWWDIDAVGIHFNEDPEKSIAPSPLMREPHCA